MTTLQAFAYSALLTVGVFVATVAILLGLLPVIGIPTIGED